MRGVERRGDLGDDLGDPARRQRPELADQRAHVAAADVPHRDEQHAARLAGLEDRDDVRVIDRGGGPRLADESLPERVVGGQRRRQDLQRDRPVEPLVVRAEHHGHAALADLLLEQIAGDPRAGREAARHAGIVLRSPRCLPYRIRSGRVPAVARGRPLCPVF